MNNLIDGNLPLSAARPRPANAGGPQLNAPQRPIGPDLRRMWALFLRHIRLFVAIAAVVFVASVVLTLRATPLYTASSSVMLDVRKQQVVDTQAVMSGLPADTAVVDSEVQVLKSRHLAARVVDTLHLDQDPEFNGRLRKPSFVGGILRGVKGLFGGSPPNAPLSALDQKKLREGIIQSVLGRLNVRRSGLTYVIEINFTSEAPSKAARIADTWADLYLTEQLETKYYATQKANRWLNERLAQLKVQVQAADEAVQQYKIANNLLSASGATLTEQEISNYNQQLATARVQEAEANARLRTAQQQLAAGSTGEDVGEALGSAVIQQLRAQRAQASANLAELQSKYGPRHPEMLKAQRNLADIDAQIQAEVRRIISNLQAQAQVARQRTAAIAGTQNAARGALATNNRAAVRLAELERNAEAVRTLYESFLNRFKQTSADQGLEQSDARIVSQANIPTSQSSPDVKRNLILGLILAVGAGAAGVLLAERLDQGLVTADDVEVRLEMPHLGAIPLMSSITEERGISPVDFVLDKPLSAFAEAFRVLRASLLYAKLGEPVRVLMVTSALPDEGKTTTAVALGRSAAQAGSRVCIVDCDLRRRNVNRLLGVEPPKGLLDVLAGQAKLEDVLLKDSRSGAVILPLAKSSFTPKDVFGSPAMERLLQELSQDYDLVLLDTAPVLAVADTRVIATRADAVLFLARWRKTPAKAVEAGLKVLTSAGAHVSGVALTQVDMKEQARYGYGDPGYYYRSYQKYYAR